MLHKVLKLRRNIVCTIGSAILVNPFPNIVYLASLSLDLVSHKKTAAPMSTRRF